MTELANNWELNNVYISTELKENAGYDPLLDRTR
jgi:hypothetical protein